MYLLLGMDGCKPGRLAHWPFKEGYCARKSSPTRSEKLERARQKKRNCSASFIYQMLRVLCLPKELDITLYKVFTVHSGLVWQCSYIKMITSGISDNWDCAVGAQRIESSRCVWRQWRVERAVLSVALESECLVPVWPHCLLVIGNRLSFTVVGFLFYKIGIIIILILIELY